MCWTFVTSNCKKSKQKTLELAFFKRSNFRCWNFLMFGQKKCWNWFVSYPRITGVVLVFKPAGTRGALAVGSTYVGLFPKIKRRLCNPQIPNCNNTTHEICSPQCSFARFKNQILQWSLLDCKLFSWICLVFLRFWFLCLQSRPSTMCQMSCGVMWFWRNARVIIVGFNKSLLQRTQLPVTVSFFLQYKIPVWHRKGQCWKVEWQFGVVFFVWCVFTPGV